LISHLFLPIKQTLPGREVQREIKPILGKIPAFFGKNPRFFELFHQFLFQCGGPQRTIAAASWFNTASDVDAGFDWRLLNPALPVSNLKYVLGP
jgi:hypothetical protein